MQSGWSQLSSLRMIELFIIVLLVFNISACASTESRFAAPHEAWEPDKHINGAFIRGYNKILKIYIKRKARIK